MFPIETLAKEYIVVPPVSPERRAREGADGPHRRHRGQHHPHLRPRPAGRQDARQRRRLRRDPDAPPPSSWSPADKKILVAQYMVGQDAGFGTSDPAMLLAVPTAAVPHELPVPRADQLASQLRRHHRPRRRQGRWSTAPPAANFMPIGATGFSVAHVKLVQRRRRQPQRHRRPKGRHQRLRRRRLRQLLVPRRPRPRRHPAVMRREVRARARALSADDGRAAGCGSPRRRHLPMPIALPPSL